MTLEETQGLNLRGKPYLQYDGAGAVTSEQYDFKGNLLSSNRRLIKDYTERADWLPLAGLTQLEDINTTAAPFLESESFTTITGYDALNRVVSLTTPDNSETRPTYNEAGLLEQVEVRLFKIRHCLDIEGVERQLALFEPPIDPALLVKAVAAGLDLGSVLADLHAPLPHYRFQVLVQNAQELAGEVKALGAALLAALEKRDTEDLAGVRATHETSLLTLVKEVRKQQVEEARIAREALQASREVVAAREAHYRALLEEEHRHRLPEELEYVAKLESARSKSEEAEPLERIAAFQAAAPGFSFGAAGAQGSPLSSISFGPEQFAASPRYTALGYQMEAAKSSHESNKASIEATWQRRDEEWGRLREDATLELVQIDKQIFKATVSETVARQELTNLEKQLEQAQEVETFLRYKYTNRELYNWMVSQISTVHYQAYKLAFDMAMG